VDVITVAASNFEGKQSFYSNEGSNVFVSSVSSGRSYDKDSSQTGPDIITTAISNSKDPNLCTPSFSGTSSATPLASGVVALMLSANPKLSSRDIQYLLVKTSDVIDPSSDSWVKNAANIKYDNSYIFKTSKGTLENMDLGVSMLQQQF